MDYQTIPFVVFFKILNNQEENIHLLGIEDPEEAKKTWESIKQQWSDENQTADQKRMLSGYKKVLDKTIEFNKLVFFKNYTLLHDSDDEKEMFKQMGVVYDEDIEKRFENLNKKIDKAQSEKEIFEARLKQIEDSVSENYTEDKVDFMLSDLYKTIATIELYHGFTIPDYNELTFGKYNAITKVIKEKK